MSEPQPQPSGPPTQAHGDPRSDYHEVIVIDSDQHEHRYLMASAPVEDAEHNLEFVDEAGSAVRFAAGTWDSWAISDVPI